MQVNISTIAMLGNRPILSESESFSSITRSHHHHQMVMIVEFTHQWTGQIHDFRRNCTEKLSVQAAIYSTLIGSWIWVIKDNWEMAIIKTISASCILEPILSESHFSEHSRAHSSWFALLGRVIVCWAKCTTQLHLRLSGKDGSSIRQLASYINRW